MALMLVQILFYYPDMPQRMASHFNFSGKPDGWSDKTGFFALWIGLIAFINLLVPFINWIMKKSSAKLINVPDKEFWLGNEANRKYLYMIVENLMLMITCLVDLIFLYGLQQTYEVNVHGHSNLPMVYIIILLVAVTIFPLIYVFRKLKVTPEMKHKFELEKSQKKNGQTN